MSVSEHPQDIYELIMAGREHDVTSLGQGFVDYNDTSTSASPLILVADTWTTVPNNGLGAFTNKTYAPRDGLGNIIELMDVATGSIDPRSLNLGDSILIRNDITVNPDTNNCELQLRYSLGNGANVYTLGTTVATLDNGSDVDYRFSLEPDYIYMGDTNTRDNLIQLQVKLSTSGTLVNAGSVIQLLRR